MSRYTLSSTKPCRAAFSAKALSAGIVFRECIHFLSDQRAKSFGIIEVDSPELQQAYNLREELTEIFEGKDSKEGAKDAINAWSKKVRMSGVKEYASFLTTLENWLDDIANYFIDRHTSGFVEGFNNKLKVIKRRCYGILNVTHLFQRIHLDLYGHSLFAMKIIEL